mgnify:CR=1 FL=1
MLVSNKEILGFIGNQKTYDVTSVTIDSETGPSINMKN